MLIICLLTFGRPFFDACDGIFLNYHWSGAHLAQSAQAAGRRKFDVYAVRISTIITSRSHLKGVDVFGRGTYGGGGFNSRTAAEAAIQAGLSTGDMQ